MWISVKERLPEVDGWFEVKALYQTDRERFYEASDCGFTHEVTHWWEIDDERINQNAVERDT